jgi:hypothetical protein
MVSEYFPEVRANLTSFHHCPRSHGGVQRCQELPDDSDRFLTQPRHVFRVAVKECSVGTWSIVVRRFESLG